MSTTLKLSPAAGTFPFAAKAITLAAGTRVTLGSTEMTGAGGPPRTATSANGWFAPKRTEDITLPDVSPLPLSPSHAEVWTDGGKVYIRDLDTAFGTFVNGTRILIATALNTGDTISLGSRIPRNDKTPSQPCDR
ncbi:unnamed protein product [Cyclocybe aegerita]|uniref:FHA domain-containing protein n=1 Tax=Cyclocybe aegerita TaxID=1973307 RepID=A0A8S0WA49_CYCAE|nr:unnamed protein product [Cyclocybe aegerita]